MRRSGPGRRLHRSGSSDPGDVEPDAVLEVVALQCRALAVPRDREKLVNRGSSRSSQVSVTPEGASCVSWSVPMMKPRGPAPLAWRLASSMRQ